MYFRDAMAAVVVYDITDRDTFQNAKNWVEMVSSEAGDTVIATCLVGTKCDLVSKRAVTKDAATAFAEENG